MFWGYWTIVESGILHECVDVRLLHANESKNKGTDHRHTTSNTVFGGRGASTNCGGEGA